MCQNLISVTRMQYSTGLLTSPLRGIKTEDKNILNNDKIPAKEEEKKGPIVDF